MVDKLEAAEADRRNAMRDHEQMLDAEKMCVPCKLCGGAAKISDAGTGAGYYIECSNSTNWRDSTGCLINERRLGGWAYNVMDWWNRLHAATPANGEQVERAFRAGYDAGYNFEAGVTEQWDTENAAWSRYAATLSTPTEDARSRVKVLEEAAGIADGLAYIARENKQHLHPLPCDTNEAWRRVEDACWDIAESIRALGNKETYRHG